MVWMYIVTTLRHPGLEPLQHKPLHVLSTIAVYITIRVLFVLLLVLVHRIV